MIRMSGVLTLLVLTGCGGGSTPPLPPLACTGMESPALKVTVRDAQTGASVGSKATIVAALRGGKTDTVARSLDPVIVVGNLAGTYDVAITAPGFADWTKNGIVVLGSGGLACEPIAQAVDAQLSPVP